MSVRMEIGILGIAAVILASEIDQFQGILPIRAPFIINNIMIQSINQQIVGPPHYAVARNFTVHIVETMLYQQRFRQDQLA